MRISPACRGSPATSPTRPRSPRSVAAHRVRAIIHLAALQVPFCKADPVAGARANVVGTVNVLEAARHHGLKRVAYASSIAALELHAGRALARHALRRLQARQRARPPASTTRTGACPRIGIRPGVVYGVARDQGLTSKTTVAILAAAAGRPYTMPFTGAVSALHAGEVASAFIRAVARGARRGARLRPQRPRDLGRRMARPPAGHRTRRERSPWTAPSYRSRPTSRTRRSGPTSATTARCRSRTASARPTTASSSSSPKARSSPDAVA